MSPKIWYMPADTFFENDCDALVNPVNCEGVSGRGLALEFKKRFPESVQRWALAGRGRRLHKIGVVFVHQYVPGKFIYFFPTKDKWRDTSKIAYIERGLASLVSVVNVTDRDYRLQSIKIPALGCGLGGLDWNVVRPLIESAAKHMRVERVIICEPMVTQ